MSDTQDNLNNAPDLEGLSFDDIFGPTPGAPAAPNTAPPEIPQVPPAPQEPFLRTSTGTVYKTPEDAIRGTEEKDRRINQMRQLFIAANGYDPIDGKQVNLQPQVEETNYATNPEQFYKDLAEANGYVDPATKAYVPANPRRYAEVMSKWMNDTYVGPMKPTWAHAAEQTVVNQLEAEMPGFKEFLASDKYRNYLSENRLLQDAIDTARSEPQIATSQLHSLLRLAYDAANGKSLPETLRTAKVQTPPAPRPTMQPTTTPVPSGPAVQHDLSTPEGRRAIMEAGKARGLDKQVIFPASI